MSKYGSGGRLVIPKNSKWSMAAGICMIVAMVLHIILDSYTNHWFIGTTTEGTNYVAIPLVISTAIFYYLPFIVISFLPEKNIKLYAIPISLSIIGLMITYIGASVQFLYPYISYFAPNIPNFVFYKVVYGPNVFIIYLLYFISLCPYIALLVIVNLVSSGKILNKNKVFKILLSVLSVCFIMNSLFGLKTYDIGKAFGYIILDIFPLVPYVILLLGLNNIQLCPKCGTLIKNAGKFCNICGEQLSIQ